MRCCLVATQCRVIDDAPKCAAIKATAYAARCRPLCSKFAERRAGGTRAPLILAGFAVMIRTDVAL